MDEIPWHLVAIIFITFAIWLRDRIREASEWRRRRKAEKKAKEFARRAAGNPPRERSPYLADYGEEEEEAETVEEPRWEPATTLKDLFPDLPLEEEEPEEEEWIEPAAQQTYEETETSKSPPPLPGALATADYEDIDPTVPSEPLEVRRTTRFTGRKPTESIARVLRDKDKLRSAILIKEILDKPKALREESSF